MLTKEQIIEQIHSMTDQELRQVSHVIAAGHRALTSPLSFVEELIHYQFLGFNQESQVYLHQMTITEQLKNRMGTLHGGLIATFCDTAIGASVIAELGVESQSVTLDLAVKYLSPGLQGKLRCETKIVKKGKTIISAEAKITDEREKLITTATATFYRIK